ncbi:hypothetical protein BKA67DRAFT_677698 [Truncatella angustata]|uniref:Uncharacterized protein n=1 Tax=Truncatella angustata TaxID=152316 RepID=A0A9P8ZW30_9PEZI|nr:uncharacterized protein BKA67DRAFT_677698 [Truncatella angustata]KAH6652621.1 hypothetical protein BKA67DRAFT_677698 [Truncatella angustata]
MKGSSKLDDSIGESLRGHHCIVLDPSPKSTLANLTTSNFGVTVSKGNSNVEIVLGLPDEGRKHQHIKLAGLHTDVRDIGAPYHRKIDSATLGVEELQTQLQNQNVGISIIQSQIGANARQLELLEQNTKNPIASLQEGLMKINCNIRDAERNILRQLSLFHIENDSRYFAVVELLQSINTQSKDQRAVGNYYYDFFLASQVLTLFGIASGVITTGAMITMMPKIQKMRTTITVTTKMVTTLQRTSNCNDNSQGTKNRLCT